MDTNKKKSLSRREFLKGTAVSSVAIAGSTLLAGCKPAAETASNLPETWDKETDVVVVGYGGAGAAAAIAAREAGVEVLILEKMMVAGGSSAISGGVYYAGGTSVQKEFGIEDSADKMYEHYLNTGKGFNDPKLARLAADYSAANVEKLIELGATFPDPPTIAGAEYHAGSEPIARVHAINFEGKTGGAAYFGALDSGVKKLGAEIMLETKAEELIVDADGQVVGVVADQSGTKMNIKARKGVILSTGGFTRNEQMLKDYSQQGYYCQPLGAPGLDGDGLKMAFALGAAASNITEVLAIPGLTLPGSKAATYAFWTFVPTIPAILINNRGERFTDEFGFYDWKATALLKQPDKYSYSLFDAKGRDAGAGMFVMGWTPDLEQEVADGIVVKADTLEELAELIEVPADRLAATIAKWNEDVAAGVDSDYGRTGGLDTIDTAPFYAFKTFAAMFDNMGGLKINENGQVIDVKDSVISRLYAAGNVAGGVLGEDYPGSGSAYNAGVTFGTISGKHAAALENWG